jgi:hypothetical protein
MTKPCSLRCAVSDLEHLKFRFVSDFPCLRRSGSRLREAPASAGVGRSRRQVLRYSSSHPFDTQTTEELVCPAPQDMGHGQTGERVRGQGE